MSPSKTILIAHRSRDIRERFAQALAGDARAVVAARTREEVARYLADPAPLSLAMIDLALAEDGVALVEQVRRAAGRHLPVIIFAGTVPSAETALKLAAFDVGYINEHAAVAEILPAVAPYLFPDTYNRRSSPRVTVGLPVWYQSGDTIAAATTHDVGKGGITVRTMNPLPKGTALQVRFRLPNGRSDIEAAGCVIWSDARIGMGVRFDQVATNDRRALDAFVDAAAPEPPA
jgi:uncharacterized protein (TIGR02266 family)